MPRPAVTNDAFSAIAEPNRRELIKLLADGEAHAVNDLVAQLDLPQPAVSKHLAVLREVGLVSMTKDGQRRLYRLEPKELKTVQEWIQMFERLWSTQLSSIKERAERKAAQQSLQRQADERRARESAKPEPEN